MSEKAFTRLITSGKGHVCKVCGEDSIIFADTRALKKHYLDRYAHSAEQVIRAGVLLEVISKEEADLQAVRKIYEAAEFIEPVGPDAEAGLADKYSKIIKSSTVYVDEFVDSDDSVRGTMY